MTDHYMNPLSVTAAVLLVISCSLSNVAVPDAYYYRTAMVGQTVKFPCHTKLDKAIDWTRLTTNKSRKMDIYDGNLGLHSGLDSRFTVLDKNDSYTLVIYNVTVDDSATYECIKYNGFSNKHFYVLTVEESPAYTAMEVVVGETVKLPCNTSWTSDFMWTHDNGDGYVDYVYWKRRINKPRLSIGVRGLVISNVQLTDSGLYDCYVGERRVGYQLNVTEKTSTAAVNLPAIILSVIIVVVVVVSIGCYRLRLRLYTRWRFHPFDRDECLGEDMDYDVFLCCSSLDNEPGHRLLESVEANGYRVCYHERDFMPGLIADNIEASVTRSKRTVCLVTENFIRSSFCMFEFETALLHWITKKRTRRVIVLMALDRPNDLYANDASDTAVLRCYLRQYTYIDYTADDWLDKLIYALPLHGMNQQQRPNAGDDEEQSTLLL